MADGLFVMTTLWQIPLTPNGSWSRQYGLSFLPYTLETLLELNISCLYLNVEMEDFDNPAFDPEEV